MVNFMLGEFQLNKKKKITLHTHHGFSFPNIYF